MVFAMSMASVTAPKVAGGRAFRVSRTGTQSAFRSSCFRKTSPRVGSRVVVPQAAKNDQGVAVYVVPMDDNGKSSSTMDALGVKNGAVPAMKPAPIAPAKPAAPAPPPTPGAPGGGSAGPPHRVTDDVLKALVGDGVKAAGNLELLFKKAVLAGIFIGLGGVLCSSVGGDVPGLMAENPGLQRAVFGALGFPVSIFLVTTLGASAFTGTIVMVAAALAAARMSYKDAYNVLGVAWAGNAVGLLSVAALAASGAMDAVVPCMAISVHKASATWAQTFFRGIGGGILICCAISQAYAARDGVSKLLGIWFCISTYVMCGWEHGLANLFFFPCALFGDASGAMSWGIFISRNLIPSTLGNLVGGVILGVILTMIHTPGTLGKTCEIPAATKGEQFEL